MIERKIRLTDTEEVKDFVRAAGKMMILILTSVIIEQ